MAKQEKVDLYRRYPSEYVTPKEPVFVVVGPAKYLSITGRHDYKVCHLEGQWWAADSADYRSHKPNENGDC